VVLEQIEQLEAEPSAAPKGDIRRALLAAALKRCPDTKRRTEARNEAGYEAKSYQQKTRPLARPGSWLWDGNGLEDELRTQLQDAGKVRAIHFEQSGAAGPKASATGGIRSGCAGTSH